MYRIHFSKLAPNGDTVTFGPSCVRWSTRQYLNFVIKKQKRTEIIMGSVVNKPNGARFFYEVFIQLFSALAFIHFIIGWFACDGLACNDPNARKRKKTATVS